MTHDTPTCDQLLAALDAEEAELNTLFTRISDAQWSGPTRDDGWTVHDIAGHIGDSAESLARLAGMTPAQLGPLDLHALNAQTRQKNRASTRAEIEALVGRGFAAARAAARPGLDLARPSLLAGRSIGQLLLLITEHAAGHREEIEALLG